MSKNLSEVLFAEKYNVQETSTLIANSGSKKNKKLHNRTMDGEEQVGWYRLIKLMQWAWQGLDIIDCYEVLAKISASKNKRSDPELLDTVIGFRSGNWSYEWSSKGMKFQREANELVKFGHKEQAKKAFYLASQCYSIASYPHLKGDENSIQAQLLAFSNYRCTFDQEETALLKEILVPFKGRNIRCYLHLPNDDVIHPVVIVSGGIDTLQCDFLPLFEKQLKPAGLAMLTVDMPGVGFSSQLKLEQDTSQLHQAVLHYMTQVPWVDQARMSLMGMRMGGNVANRLAYLEPQLVKTVVSVGAAVGSVFDSISNFSKLPPMTLDCLASRMQIKSSDVANLYQSCVPFSLVKQGLLGRTRTKTPILSIGHSKDILCNEEDLKLIARASYESEANIIDKPPIFASYLKSLEYSAQWLTQHLQE
ncbi:esterase FrsA [Psychromonas sp. RZ22]|uniref:esterase FrsA n=1 Tax=Psychromonas algarum TaxID=2555643 RepID=UPI00106852AD|nr:esterase FrsA [Psychromonas sp. RZ22]TEW56685.1 esterase FrsA [Psychromonas sp. RZ22]